MQGLSLIKGTNQNLTTLTEDSRAALVIKQRFCGTSVYYSKRGKIIRGSSN